jgi:uncharacterized protein DUF5684
MNSIRRTGWIHRGLAVSLLTVLVVGIFGSAHITLAQDIDNRAAGAVLAGVFFMIGAAIVLVMYVYISFCLQTIAKKTNAENAWLAWIPIANIILMLNIARKPAWWILLMFVPLVNIVIAVIVWMEIAKARSKPEWWGILMVVPFVNLVAPGYLAFSD